MRIILLLIGLSCSAALLGQQTIIRQFDEKTIAVDTLISFPCDLKANFRMGSDCYIKAANANIPLNRIAFIDGPKSFANVTGFVSGNSPVFASLEALGRIDVYEYKQTSGMTVGGSGPFTFLLYQPKLFYRKGLSQLKKADYRNLISDIGEHGPSAKELRTFRNKNRFHWVALPVGAAAIIYGIAQGIPTTEDLLIITGGFTLVSVSMFISLKQHENIERAIDAYNQH